MGTYPGSHYELITTVFIPTTTLRTAHQAGTERSPGLIIQSSPSALNHHFVEIRHAQRYK